MLRLRAQTSECETLSTVVGNERLLALLRVNDVPFHFTTVDDSVLSALAVLSVRHFALQLDRVFTHVNFRDIKSPPPDPGTTQSQRSSKSSLPSSLFAPFFLYPRKLEKGSSILPIRSVYPLALFSSLNHAITETHVQPQQVDKL
jgi:hypothetical protein